MLDLNLSFVHEGEKTTLRGDLEESGTSNSSIVNAEGGNSSNCEDEGDGDNFHCFNFDILKVGDTGALLSNSNDEDRTTQSQCQTRTRSEFVTQTLFPLSHAVGRRFEHEQQVNSLIPNNNELQETRLIEHKHVVQHNQVGKKSRRGPRSRSSQYRGVTFYRRTGRWESHIWDCGKQVYLGGFDTAHAAARAYDRAALKFRGVDADINFNLSDYEDDMNQQIKNLSKEEFVHILRRHSNGFSRGRSKYQGTSVIKSGRLEAQTGQFLGKKIYDHTAIKSNSHKAAKIFEANTYVGETVRASNSGYDHNLDLNLGISTPPFLGKGSSRNNNLEHMHLNHHLHDIRRLQAENPATMTLKGLPVITDHGQSSTGMYPTFFHSYEVSATNNQMIGGSSHGPSNRAWQVHGQSDTPTTLFTAASSGFPAPPVTVCLAPYSFNPYLNHSYQITPPPQPPPQPPPSSPPPPPICFR